MKTSSLLIAALTLVAAATSGLAYYEFKRLQAIRPDALAPAERARLQQAAWDAQKRIHQLESQLAAVSAMGATATAAKTGGDHGGAMGQLAADYLARLDDPEVRRIMDLQRLAAINRQYAQFFHDAHLSPEQIRQFQQLMLERQRAETDVLMAATQQGVNPMSDPQAFRDLVKNAQAEVDQQLSAALGADQYAQMKSYQQGQAQRAVVNQLSQDLSYSDTPLTDAQRQQLVSAVASTNPTGGSSVNAKTLAAAQGFLAPAQLQALQNLQQLQQANAQLGQMMARRP